MAGFGILAALLIWLVPIGITVWLLVMAVRAVQALESIAQSLRERNHQ